MAFLADKMISRTHFLSGCGFAAAFLLSDDCFASMGTVAKTQADALVWLLLGVCGILAVCLFFWLWIVTRQSRGQLREDVSRRFDGLRTVQLEAQKRFQKIDVQVVDKLRSLSKSGAQAFSVMERMIEKMNQRLLDTQKLLDSGSIEDLLKAREVLESPIDNSGSAVDGLFFADTILVLQPDQFSLAIDMMAELIERDLARSPEERERDQILGPPQDHVNRQRRFTIRSFFRSLTGGH